MTVLQGWVRAVVLAAVAVGLAAVPADAQHVLLQISPRAGDTLHMRLDQEVDVSRTSRRSGDSVVVVTTTTLFVLMRTIVEHSDSTGTDVLAVTDSVSAASTGGHGSESTDAVRRALQGTRVRMHVAHDGGTVMVDPTDEGSPELREVLAEVPATLPRRPIGVGHTWERTMAAPLGRAYAGQGEIKARFRLDSVSRGGDAAYVSMRGTLTHGRSDPAVGSTGGASAVTVVGDMVIDRRRGWLTDSHFVISVESTFTPPPSSAMAPMRFRMTATQWLRTVDRP